MKKIIIIFSILLIVFALIIFAAKIYGTLKDKQNETQMGSLNKPSISVEKITEETCRIAVSYDEGIDKVAYWWNDEKSNIIENNMNGSIEFNKPIPIPEGDYNKLYIKVDGTDGSSNQIEQVFEKKVYVEDPNKPKISCYHYKGTTRIDIIASSEKGIKEIAYNWEGEDPIVIQATQEKQKELKIEIEAKRGTNRLYITATDLEGNKQSKEDNFIGILEPEFNVYIENDILKINIKHDMGFKKVVIKINGQEMIYDENNPQYSRDTTDLNIDFKVQPGTLDVELRVYTLEAEDIEYFKKASTVIQ